MSMLEKMFGRKNQSEGTTPKTVLGDINPSKAIDWNNANNPDLGTEGFDLNPDTLPEYKKPEESPAANVELKKEPEIEKAAETSTPNKKTKKEGFGSKAKRFFKNMAEGAKTLAVKSYDKMSQAAKESPIVGKVEIFFNQRGIEAAEAEQAQLRAEIAEFDSEISTLEKAKADLETAKSGIVGQVSTDSLDVKLKVLDLKISELKKEKAESEKELDESVAEQKSFTEKRDAIADKFIKAYEEKLGEVEKESTKLQTELSKVNLLISGQEIRHAEELEKLGDLEKQKDNLLQAFAVLGMSERQSRKDETIRNIDNKIKKTKESLAKEAETLAKQKAEIEKSIAENETKAEPFKEKKAIFVSVKERKPVTPINTPDTTSTATPTTPASAAPTTPATSTVDNGGSVETQKGKIVDLVKLWNDQLRVAYTESTLNGEVVDLREFTRLTTLREDSKLNAAQAKNLLEGYYRAKGLPMEKFKNNIKNIKMFKNID